MSAYEALELVLLGAAIFLFALGGLALIPARVAACWAAAAVIAAVWFLPLLELVTT